MPQVTLPHPLTAGTKARGSHVRGNDEALQAGVNAIDNSQILANADIAGTKLLNNSTPGTKLSDDSVPAVKLADDDTLGEGCNLSELYAGAGSDDTGSFPKTNVMASRQQQGGKTIWTYFGIAIANVGTNYILDNSIDWRKRLIFIFTEYTVTTTPRADIPNGAGHGSIAGPIVTGGVFGGMNGGLFFAENGQDGTLALPSLTLELGGAGNAVRFFVNSANGNLMVRATAISLTGINLNAKIDCSPHLATT